MRFLFDGGTVRAYNDGTMAYKSIVIIQKEGKWFVARSLELGVASQGRTIDEARRNVHEAIELYLEDDPRAKRILSKEAPFITSVEL